MAQAVHGLRRMTIVKLYGIHVYRQENIMEKNILFTSDNNTLQEKNTDYEIFNIEDDYPLSKHTAHQSFGLDHDSVMTRLQLLLQLRFKTLFVLDLQFGHNIKTDLYGFMLF
jgi:hypothetical protein